MCSHRQDLPSEIIDHIIGFLWGNAPALRNCALTCRTWLPASRHILFSSLQVSIFQRSHLESLISKSKSVPPVLTAYNVLVPGLIVDETYCTQPPAEAADEFPLQVDRRRFAHTFAFRLPSVFPNLTSLELWFVDWSRLSVHRSVFDLGFPLFARLTTLVLFSVTFDNFADLKRLVQGFPQLSSLKMSRTTWRRGMPAITRPGSEPFSRGGPARCAVRPKLAALFTRQGMDPSSSIAVMDWLLHTSSATTLEQVAGLSVETALQAEHVDGFLRCIASSLRELEISYDKGIAAEGQELLRPLPIGPRLRRLLIYLCSEEPTSAPPASSCLMTVLSAIPASSRLHHLQISIVASESASAIDWKAMRKTMEAQHFRALEVVSIIFRSTVPSAGFDIRQPELRQSVASELALVAPSGVEMSFELYCRFDGAADGPPEPVRFIVHVGKGRQTTTEYYEDR
ncbi:hypothetical protein B0H21DRAFT_708479 [Amylocystis lapponica]|nr:hypothetical protein B0H21DRAFT_708479 [Amylocystis lapponica]